MSKIRFEQRSTDLELMDTHPFSPEEFLAYLRELERVNVWSLAYRPTLQWLRRPLSVTPESRPVTILDIGSGYGDMLRQIWHWGQQRGIEMDLVGIDSNPWAKEAAAEATPKGAPLRFETASLFDYALSQPFDLVICSLFAHHLGDEENVRLLRWMNGHAQQGWFINDLHRHPLPYFCAKYLARLLRLNPAVRHDGPLSILRAFTAADWHRLLHEAGFPPGYATIDWSFPFRYCVGHWKPVCR